MRHIVILFTLFLFTRPTQAQPTLWQPEPGTRWQWQLSGTINTSWDVAMYDIDLYETPQATIDLLHQEGRVVICYFSAGSWESYRDDADDFPPEVLGNVLDGWEDERWLDIRRIDLLAPIMEARFDTAVAKGCDGVEPDNVDGYINDSGFDLTYNDQLAYNIWLATEAHERYLSIGLKNDLDQIPDLVDHFDWALNEQCFQYKECDLLLPFIDAGKAVFGVEYQGDPLIYCPKAMARGFSWLTKKLNLGDIPPRNCADRNLPHEPLLIAPEQDATGVSTIPTFQWTGGNSVTYKLVIYNKRGMVVYRKKLTSDAVCSGLECAFTLAGFMMRSGKTYRWRIVAKNPQGKVKSVRYRLTTAF
jgi:hypothetical protein